MAKTPRYGLESAVQTAQTSADTAQTTADTKGIVTEWQSYSPVYEGSTIVSQNVLYRRVGNMLEVEGAVDAGVDNATDFTISLPVGLNIDSTLVEERVHTLGTLLTNRSTSRNINTETNIVAHLFYNSASTTKVYGSALTATIASNFLYAPQGTSSFLGGSTDFAFSFKVPIQGWTAT